MRRWVFAPTVLGCIATDECTDADWLYCEPVADRCRCVRSCGRVRLGDVFVWVPIIPIEYNLDSGTKSLAPRELHLLGNTLLLLAFG
jgi:hypothetical protein